MYTVIATCDQWLLDTLDILDNVHINVYIYVSFIVDDFVTAIKCKYQTLPVTQKLLRYLIPLIAASKSK